jgi:hypothetical protein
VMPQRIQLRRTKGWRKPEGAVVVARPSKWGNPFRGEFAGDEFARYLKLRCLGWPVLGFGYPSDDEIRTELAGRDLACWCSLGADVHCHADVLLELANEVAA